MDRLWPRGLRKAEAAIDLRLKDIAPSNELRKWFEHDPGKWPEFKKRYFSELKARQGELEAIAREAKKELSPSSISRRRKGIITRRP